MFGPAVSALWYRAPTTPSPAPSIVLRTTKPVPAGAELTISYIPLELPLKARRELLANYFFDCRCARCTAEAGAGLTVGPVRLGPTARPARRTPKAGLAAD